VAEPTAKPKGKKGDFLKRKVAGIPMPVILVVGAVAAYYLYSKYKSNSASTSSAATPTASSSAPTDAGGGYVGSGGGYTGSSPTTTGASPTDTSSLTPAPPATTTARSITPIGKKTITIGGKSYSTVSGFIQNGATYLGINNPAEAKRLTAAGVDLVHNPNDPNGKGLFVLIPKGASGPTIKKPAVHSNATSGAVAGPPQTADVIRTEQAAATHARTTNNAAAAPPVVRGTPNRRQILARTGQRIKTPKRKVPAK
jgi:hypothetical protein